MPLNNFVSLDLEQSIWERVFTVAPLVVIGTKEGEGFDLAPKHMAMPLGWGNFFGFACSPDHQTYHNAKRHRSFTVSYPRPEQVSEASLTASGPLSEEEGPRKPVLQHLSVIPAMHVNGVFLAGAYLMLECELHGVVEKLGENNFLIGRIVAAHAAEDALHISDADHQQRIAESPLLAYVHPGRYAEVGDTKVFPLPENFRL